MEYTFYLSSPAHGRTNRISSLLRVTVPLQVAERESIYLVIIYFYVCLIFLLRPSHSSFSHPSHLSNLLSLHLILSLSHTHTHLVALVSKENGGKKPPSHLTLLFRRSLHNRLFRGFSLPLGQPVFLPASDDSAAPEITISMSTPAARRLSLQGSRKVRESE